ncbi:hypothetical protein SUGI_0428290 [Cryptomeria japonica]|uniref:inorganic phosphate transporter 1-2-like n=1 Tax=Cryptomeria japonica TaxID=3369 RepID=UPI0024089B85|nr:inorganic phosphate transporter 1-2-like [Cryptomeria japonica]GLJ22732.1 hypothetical protein SUGI_0428290 [Cryptomeria japonica]
MASRVLLALDGADTQYYHFSAVFVGGMGIFTDAYDLFCIPIISNLLGRIYYKDDNHGLLPNRVKGFVEGIALFGALAGQLFFGWLGDRMGRKKVYGITLTLMVVSSIASGFSIGNSRESVLTCLCFFRFWLGFGIGGDYPLSATIMSEYANTRTRGAFMAAVFGMQGLGIVVGSTVEIFVSLSLMKANAQPSQLQQDFVWRIILMFGAFPAGLTFYRRMKIPETARYTALVTRNGRQAVLDMSRVLHLEIEEDEECVSSMETPQPRFGFFSRDFMKYHGVQLLGTASSWFFVDLAFYSSSLFQRDIIYRSKGGLIPCHQLNPVREVFYSARAQLVIVAMGTLPGYVFTIFLIDRIGRRKIQFIGFFFMSAFLFTLAITYNQWVNKLHTGFLVIYSLTFFFANFGPNTTTFIVPAELFPARLRSTCHGISAAAGKAGAIIGIIAFLAKEPQNNCTQSDHEGLRVPLIILALAGCLGFFCTFLIPETMRRSLEENEIEPTLSDLEVEFGPGFASRDHGRVPIEP